MNIVTLCVPFTLFHLWRTSELNVPEWRSRYTIGAMSSEDDGYVLKRANTHRINRQDMLRPGARLTSKQDVGYHYRPSPTAQREEGHTLFEAMHSPVPTRLLEWRLSVPRRRGSTIMWVERSQGAEEAIPYYIVPTNYGWQTLESFKRNTHMKLYRPLGGMNGRVVRANFREINRECMTYHADYGWYDSSKHAIINTAQGARLLHDVSDTFEHNGRVYPISAGGYNVYDTVKLREFVRALVKHVMTDRLDIHEARKALHHALRHDDMASLVPTNYVTLVPQETMWRGLYTGDTILLPVEVVKVLRQLASDLPIVQNANLVEGECQTCQRTIYSWEPHETAEIDINAFHAARLADSRGTPDIITYRYCDEAHALQHSIVAAPVGVPEKHGYHTDVLRHIPMGVSRRRGVQGQLRYCGIELETFHAERSVTAITPYVVGGTIAKKMKEVKPAKKVPTWNNTTYKKFGAIPTRDGSLHDYYGVEWVFRPSGIEGLTRDVEHFIHMTSGYIEHDADSEDASYSGRNRYDDDDSSDDDESPRTYGLHIHVTATDTMQTLPTRVRVAVVARCLDNIIQTIGQREYSNYTRQFNCGSLINVDIVKGMREGLRRHLSQRQAPAWMKYVKPGACGERDRLESLYRERGYMSPQRDMRGCDLFGEGIYHSNLLSRYNMVNITVGRPTIEFRHARSFVDSNYIMLNVELAQAVALFASYEMMSVAQVSRATTPYVFRDYVFKNHREYPRLAQWFLQHMGANLTSHTRVRGRIGG